MARLELPCNRSPLRYEPDFYKSWSTELDTSHSVALSTCDTNKWSTLKNWMDSAVRRPPDQHISSIYYESPDSIRQLADWNRSLHQPQRRLSETGVVRMRQRYEEGATVYELSIEFGIDRRTVSTRLKDAGVAMRLSSPTTDDICAMVRLRESGVPIAKIAEQLGFCANTVRLRLQRRTR